MHIALHYSWQTLIAFALLYLAIIVLNEAYVGRVPAGVPHLFATQMYAWLARTVIVVHMSGTQHNVRANRMYHRGRNWRLYTTGSWITIAHVL